MSLSPRANLASRTSASPSRRGTRSAADQMALPLPGVAPIDQTSAKPFVRWAGGKARLLQAILPHCPPHFRSYHEPFLGSGAVFFALRPRLAGRCYLTDLNLELINLWQIVRDRPKEFLAQLEPYRGKDSEEDYYSIRDGKEPKGRLQRAARFFYLNQTAWNGLW